MEEEEKRFQKLDNRAKCYKMLSNIQLFSNDLNGTAVTSRRRT